MDRGALVSDIFVSYANADRPRVKPLVDALLREGWSVWWDRAMLPGETWDQVIEVELAAARCVIVLWSRTSVHSDWVRTEAEAAKERGVLVPALLDDVNIPLAFKRLQAANLVEWSGVLPSAGFDELARGVSEVLSRLASSAEAAVSGTGAAALEAPQMERVEVFRGAGGERVRGTARDRPKVGQAVPEQAAHGGSTRTIRLGVLVLVGTSVLASIAGITWYISAGHTPIPHQDTNGQHGKTSQQTTDKHVGNNSGQAGSTPLLLAAEDGKQPAAPEGPKSPIPKSVAVDFNGAWTADMRYKLWDPEKTYHERFQFEILGNDVVGSASLMGIPRAISDGRVHGGDISFVTKYPLSIGEQENRYRGSIAGDLIQFIYQDPDDGALIHFTAARVRP